MRQLAQQLLTSRIYKHQGSKADQARGEPHHAADVIQHNKRVGALVSHPLPHGQGTAQGSIPLPQATPLRGRHHCRVAQGSCLAQVCNHLIHFLLAAHMRNQSTCDYRLANQIEVSVWKTLLQETSKNNAVSEELMGNGFDCLPNSYNG